MKSIMFLSFTIGIFFVTLSLNAQEDETSVVKGTYLGLNDDYEYVFELEDESQMIFHEVDDEYESMLTEESIHHKFRITYVEEVIKEEEEEFEDNPDGGLGKSFIYRKIIELKEL